jgi:hypothetical protein
MAHANSTAKPMLQERRKDQRYAINRGARFQTELGALPRDCLITDISATGARIFAEGVEVPDRFWLLTSGPEGGRRECQVIWRLGGEIGIEFIGPARPERQPGRW